MEGPKYHRTRPQASARAFAVAVASVSLLAAPLARPATAATQPASCARVGSPAAAPGKTTTAAFRNCLPARATGGGGTATATIANADTGQLTETIKWFSGHGTTKLLVKFAPANGRGRCPSNTTRFSLTGKVVSSSGSAARVIKAGQPNTAHVCLTNANATSLEPGTVERF